MDRDKTYEELLEDERWQEKRILIIKRDSYHCQMCGSNEDLNVHHRYYIYQHAPWDYKNHALITLCESCHRLVHETLPPLVYAIIGNKLTPMNFTPCKRCGGYGYLSEYKHVQNGICFRCKGERFEELINKKILHSIGKFIESRDYVYDSLDQLLKDEIVKLYEKGKSISKINRSQAIDNYILAARSGYGKAQNNLAVLLEEEREYEKAKRWYLYSAMQGIPQGKNNIVDLLCRNEKDKSIVKKWLPLVADDKVFQCKTAANVIRNYYLKKDNPPSEEQLILSLEILMRLASEGVEEAKELVSAFNLDDMYEEYQEFIKNENK